MQPNDPPIVIIDYDEDHLWHLTALLQQSGYRCLPFTDAKQAARYIFTESVTLVVTEVLMPELDGIEILLNIKDIKPALPLIGFCGGRDFPLYLSVMEHLGAAAVFAKPVDAASLLLAVARCAASGPHRRVSPQPPAAAALDGRFSSDTILKRAKC